MEDQAEQDSKVIKRLSSLQKWKDDSIQNMKLLLKKLRNSVNGEDFDKINSELQILKEKHCDSMEIEQQYHKKTYKYHKLEKENRNLTLENERLEDILIESKSESRVIKKRLEYECES